MVIVHVSLAHAIYAWNTIEPRRRLGKGEGVEEAT